MPTVYPDALDDFANPTPKQSQAAPRTHSQQHGDLNDAVEAVQAALGPTTGTGPLARMLNELSEGPNVKVTFNGRENTLGLTSEVSSYAGAPTSNEWNYSFTYVVSDQADMNAASPGTKVNGFAVQHNFGGGNTSGGRHAIEGTLHLTAATKATNTDRNYAGVQGTARAYSADGGGVGTQKGAVFGGSFIAQTFAPAENLLNVAGLEINSQNQTAGTFYVAGATIVGMDSVEGGDFHCGLGISNTGSAAPYRDGILFGPMNSAHPVKAAGGTLIRTSGAYTMDSGIDLSSYTFSVAHWRGSFTTDSFARIGPESNGVWIGGSGAAGFYGIKHASLNRTDATNYALLQKSDGLETLVNAGLGGAVKIRVNNADRLLVDATGVGFNGSAVAAKPTITGSRGGNAALASLLTALATMGLITDSTTA